jgi:hypothetical protein
VIFAISDDDAAGVVKVTVNASPVALAITLIPAAPAQAIPLSLDVPGVSIVSMIAAFEFILKSEIGLLLVLS